MRTAYFSIVRRPGVVLRVQTIFALVSRTTATTDAVAVAIPLMRHRKFNANRSAVKIPRAGPAMVAITSPGATAAPSLRSRRISMAGSISWKASRARSRPATTPVWRATRSVVARWPAGTMASVVRSPARPRSSSSAMRTKGSIMMGGRGGDVMLFLWVVRATAFPFGKSFYGQHSLDREACARCDIFGDRDLMLHRLQRAADVAERDRLHVRTEIAGTDEFKARVLDGDVVAHGAFGQKHDARGSFDCDVGRHGGRRAGKIGLRDDVRRAFWMCQHDDTGIVLAQLSHFLRAEAFMHLAMTGPGDHLDLGLGSNVFGQVFVRQHDHAVDAERLDNRFGVARGAADIGFRFHRSRGVDVSDDRDAGIVLPQQPDVLGRDGIRQRAAGAAVGDQDGL